MKWTSPDPKGTAPDPRTNHAACVIGKKMYVVDRYYMIYYYISIYRCTKLNRLDMYELGISMEETVASPPTKCTMI